MICYKRAMFDKMIAIFQEADIKKKAKGTMKIIVSEEV
jgi:hypothetical protein